MTCTVMFPSGAMMDTGGSIQKASKLILKALHEAVHMLLVADRIELSQLAAGLQAEVKLAILG